MARERMVLWQGISQIDGVTPVVAIATYDTSGKGSSANTKTGALVQSWILRADIDPLEAKRQGADTAVCGDCPHRSKASGGSNACYVNVGQAPLAVWRANNDTSTVTAKGNPRKTSRSFDPSVFAGMKFRIGSYGDPAAVPVHIWQQIAEHAAGVTGYTHQWRTAPKEFADFCMASVDAPEDGKLARARGFRSFIVRPVGTDKPQGAVQCPASAEAGKKLTCEQCMQCGGVSAGRKADITIQAHGSTKSSFRAVSLPLSVVSVDRDTLVAVR